VLNPLFAVTSYETERNAYADASNTNQRAVNIFLRNVCTRLPDYTVSQPRTAQEGCVIKLVAFIKASYFEPPNASMMQNDTNCILYTPLEG
jgi:hypothetical protein